MNRFFATFMRAYHSPETGGEGSAGGGALDIESRISAVLSGNEGDDIDKQGGEQGGQKRRTERVTWSILIDGPLSKAARAEVDRKYRATSDLP